MFITFVSYHASEPRALASVDELAVTVILPNGRGSDIMLMLWITLISLPDQSDTAPTSAPVYLLQTDHSRPSS